MLFIVYLLPKISLWLLGFSLYWKKKKKKKKKRKKKLLTSRVLDCMDDGVDYLCARSSPVGPLVVYVICKGVQHEGL